jgi:hypothetical protein
MSGDQDDLDALLEGMIADQRQPARARAASRARGRTDDLLQPHDHPRLAASPDFNFEDGILAGYLAFRAALRASRRR